MYIRRYHETTTIKTLETYEGCERFSSVVLSRQGSAKCRNHCERDVDVNDAFNLSTCHLHNYDHSQSPTSDARLSISTLHTFAYRVR